MFISKHRLERLEARIDELERSTVMNVTVGGMERYWDRPWINTVLYQLLSHLKLDLDLTDPEPTKVVLLPRADRPEDAP